MCCSPQRTSCRTLCGFHLALTPLSHATHYVFHVVLGSHRIGPVASRTSSTSPYASHLHRIILTVIFIPLIGIRLSEHTTPYSTYFVLLPDCACTTTTLERPQVEESHCSTADKTPQPRSQQVRADGFGGRVPKRSGHWAGRPN